MPLNIKNPKVEALAAELARITGESKTEAIRQALLERHARLRFRVSEAGRRERIRRGGRMRGCRRRQADLTHGR